MTKKKRRLVKINDMTHAELQKMSYELSAMEGKKVDMGEIPERLMKSPEVKEMLRRGAKLRRQGYR